MQIEENEITSARRAISRTKDLIESHTQDKVLTIYPINNEKHYVFVTDKGLSYVQVFKRNFFMSFGAIFGKKGIGESINQEMVEFAEENGIQSFVFVYQNGSSYIVPVKELKDYAIANGTIRTTSSGETTMSVPIGLLRPWK